MKFKFYIVVFIFGLLFTSVTSAYAGTRITGAAFGENIGLIHLDFATAMSPFAVCPEPEDPLNPNCPSNPDYSDYHLGFRNEFYIDKTDLQSSGSGDPLIAASITDTTDCAVDACYLEGFIWSDAIGWIILDGQSIQTQGFPSSPGDFPESSFAQIDFNGVLTGYIWSQNTGWIRLSSDTFNPILNQNATNWGVYMDPFEAEVEVTNPDCAVIDNQPECETYPHVCEWDVTCLSKTINLGHKFYGYAWSEKLGWIKFDTDELGIGVYTTWVPDITPPVINAEGGSWFANDNANGILDWPFFATDEESGINVALTDLEFTSDIVGCNVGTIDDFDDSNDGIDITLSHPGDLSTAPAGYCEYKITGTIVNGAGLYVEIAETDPGDIVSPNEYSPPITFYVRAGDLSYPDSEIETINAGAVADGIDVIEYRFSPKDIANNPIVPVKVDVSGADHSADDPPDPSLWMRNAEIEFSFVGDEMFFDPITSVAANKNIDDVLPIKIVDEGMALGSTYNEGDDVTYPIAPTVLGPTTDNKYPVQVAAWAPTTCNDCSEFTMDGITLTVTDADIPAVTTDTVLTPITSGNQPAGIAYSADDPTLGGVNPFDSGLITYGFTPAVTIENGSLGDEQLIPAVPNNIEFTAYNNSDAVNGSNIIAVSFDNRLLLSDSGTGLGLGSVLFEFRDIYLEGDSDGFTGRADPDTSNTRFEVFKGTPGNSNDSLNNGSETVFHSVDFNPHTEMYSFSTNVQSDGKYTYTIDIPEPDDDIVYTIDRSDYLGDAVPAFTLNKGGSGSFTINFTPDFIVSGETDPDVIISMDVHQYIGYRMPDRVLVGIDDFAVYKAPDLITGVELKPVGVAATGIITGEQIYDVIGEREFETVTSPGLSTLKQQMRDNAAELTRNMIACPADTTIISGLTTDNDTCVRVDQYNQTVVAVYGGLGEVLKIGNESTVTVPNGFRYTIIVKGGADVFIQDDIEYGGTGSFGLIVLTDANGKGGNVFIDTDVTNIVGLLYAEGSILSSENGSDLCYAPGQTCELTNQLYWQGSIVSKNTIGGAPGRKIPQGIDCAEDWSITDDLKCAQAFDLDYVRRFAIRPLKDVAETILGYYIPTGRLFSGGGSCDATPTCSLGTLPTVITLKTADGKNLIDISTSKSIDPFFIEKDVRPAPPGFTTGAGFERTIEIR